jgi:hypothetical protein
MTDLKQTAQECKIGDCFLVGPTDKTFALEMPNPKSAKSGKQLVFNRVNRRNEDGLVAAVWRRTS